MASRKKVVVIGAGFAGLNACHALRNAPVDIVLIDRNNYHTFQPLLYQVATAQLEPDETARSIRATFRKRQDFRFRLGRVTSVDVHKRTVHLAGGDSENYDYLIYGAGTAYNSFGVPGVTEHALFLKTLSEAVNIRSHILSQFELADQNPSLLDEGVLNFVIVGGGPTGVELAGALTELFTRVLPADYPHLDTSRARTIIVEMSPHLLGPYSARSRAYTLRVLERRGVRVHLNATVNEVTASAALLGDGTRLPTRTLIWAAGVRGTGLAAELSQEAGLDPGRALRVPVNEDLSLPGFRNVFVSGDASGATDSEGQPYPQVAQVAIQQGRFAARQIRRHLQGRKPERFRYRDRGNMAIIGRNAGVAELSPRLGGLRLTGFLGWLGWLFIHLIYLPGYRNRFFALINWAVSYVTFDRHARLITPMVPSAGDTENREESRRDKAGAL